MILDCLSACGFRIVSCTYTKLTFLDFETRILLDPTHHLLQILDTVSIELNRVGGLAVAIGIGVGMGIGIVAGTGSVVVIDVGTDGSLNNVPLPDLRNVVLIETYDFGRFCRI